MNKEEIQKKLEAIIDELVETFPFDMTEAPYSFSGEVAKKAFNLGLEIAAENAEVLFIPYCDNHTPYRGACGNCSRYDNPEVPSSEIDKNSILKYKL